MNPNSYFAPSPQQQQSVPSSPQQATENANRKAKRHYPRVAYSQTIPQAPQPLVQPSVQPLAQQQQPYPIYNSPVPQNTTGYDAGYNQVMTGMANMSMYNTNQPVAREDVALIGQPPLIEDLHRPPPVANLPSNVNSSRTLNTRCVYIYK
jgi:protein transport protein SEC24